MVQKYRRHMPPEYKKCGGCSSLPDRPVPPKLQIFVEKVPVTVFFPELTL